MQAHNQAGSEITTKIQSIHAGTRAHIHTYTQHHDKIKTPEVILIKEKETTLK